MHTRGFQRNGTTVFCVLATLLCSSIAFGTAANLRTPQRQNRNHDDDEAEVTKNHNIGWVEYTLAAMSLREKIGQMLMIDMPTDRLTVGNINHIRRSSFGNIIFFSKNIKEYSQTRALISDLQNVAITNHGIPMLIAVDQEGGVVNRLGHLTGLKVTRYSARTLGDVFSYAPHRAAKILKKSGSAIAVMMKELGFNMNMAPVLDLSEQKDSYIYSRSFSGKPAVVSKIARQLTQTMTSHGIIATGKHFPNLSITKFDSHKVLPILARTLEQMRTHEFLPFKDLRSDLPAIMIGHIKVPAIDPNLPASMSPKIIRTLREEIGFRGLIISDDLKMKAVSDNYSLREIVIRSVFAGIDLLILADSAERQILAAETVYQAVSTGIISRSQIDNSVRRILAIKSVFAR